MRLILIIMVLMPTIGSRGGDYPAEIESLLGSWRFQYTLDDQVFERVFDLTVVLGGLNDEGVNYVLGFDGNDDPVLATYFPSERVWFLVDKELEFDRVFAFYTDGTRISDGSCYFQTDAPGGANLSACYTLTGGKFLYEALTESTGGLEPKVANAIPTGAPGTLYLTLKDIAASLK